MDLEEAMRVVTQARDEGAKAAADGKRREHNPYSSFEDELRAAGWDDGYGKAVLAQKASVIIQKGE